MTAEYNQCKALIIFWNTLTDIIKSICINNIHYE